MQAKWRGQVIAESKETLEVGGYHYFPRASVKMELLKLAPKNASDLECPHGVQFYDVADDNGRSERAAWSYEAPRGSMTSVDHWIGFWGDVELKSP
jgi:uncharacterized protein (DUF427 family)